LLHHDIRLNINKMFILVWNIYQNYAFFWHFQGEFNQICSKSSRKKMDIQIEVGRASHGLIDAAKLNCSFFHNLPVLTNPDLLEGLCPVNSHLWGGFHPVHWPPLAAGWELADPALLTGYWSYVCFCHSLACLHLLMNHSNIGSYCWAIWSKTSQHLYPALLPLNGTHALHCIHTTQRCFPPQQLSLLSMLHSAQVPSKGRRAGYSCWQLKLHLGKQ